MCSVYCGVFIGFARTKLPIAINVARVWLLRYVFIRVVESQLFLETIMGGRIHINYTVIPWATVFSNTMTAIFAYVVSVSYTHLDVYKRQSICRCSSIC